MTRVKPRGRYMAISVPMSLHDKITKYVEKTSYNSIAEFVKEAVRDKMQFTGSDMDKFLQLHDELVLLSKKMENKDNRFKDITKTLQEQKNKLKEISPSITDIDLSPEEEKKLSDYCRKHDITPSEHIRNLIDKYDKEQEKKNINGNGHGLS